MANTLKLKVEGMKCMGCVANAKAALEGLPGMQDVVINLEQATAEISGDVDAEAVIQRLTAAGYPATTAG